MAIWRYAVSSAATSAALPDVTACASAEATAAGRLPGSQAPLGEALFWGLPCRLASAASAAAVSAMSEALRERESVLQEPGMAALLFLSRAPGVLLMAI